MTVKVKRHDSDGGRSVRYSEESVRHDKAVVVTVVVVMEEAV